MTSSDAGSGPSSRSAREANDLTPIANLTAYGVVITDSAGAVLWGNAGLERVAGATATDAIGRPLISLFKVDRHNTEAIAGLSSSIAALQPYSCELAGLGAAGSGAAGGSLWLSIDLQPVLSNNVNGGGTTLVAFIRDVTDAVARRQEIMATNRRLTLAVESAHIGLWDWNVTDDLFWTSHEWWAYLGFARPQDMIGDDVADRMIHPDDLPQVRANRQAFFAERKDQLVNEMRHRDGAGRWRWVLSTGRVTQWSENGTAERVSGVYIDIDERRAVSERIAFAAHHDPLTGLPNRGEMRKHLGHALKQSTRSGEPFWVFVLDLDRFKAINDTFNHSTGDAILKSVAVRIQSAVRDVDIVARLGGDEFAILVRADREHHAVSTMIADRLLEVVRQPYRINGMMIDLSASIGIAKAPDHGSDPDTLIRNADTALYKVKANGKNDYRFFDADLEAESTRRREVEAELREALGRGEFELHYQTITALAAGRVVGVEALLRWRHGVLGLVFPDQFIPVAEESGLIVPIGDWVIKQACMDARNWRSDITVAVNVSAAQLGRGNLAATVTTALQASGLEPHRLELEVTESIFLRDDAMMLRDLRHVSDMGVRLVLDDFGTGYSSLGYLRRLPFNKIKIDRSFIADLGSDPHSSAVIVAVTSLAQSLGMASVAEGIETEDQAKMVTAAGCDLGQGYLFSRPAPVAALQFLSG
ncbi:putative bifunctional diguanylate cyclase/phosphodiesterase [Acidisoma cladoniae]|jgi:diguanylate cyclase (GGDEF)-like protein/PAS domain S-box-containing protein|uniref:putative bifunctional diguanylate cyclase/phosphodiesterase n=1 Tax=Acidisoma cladoniae TaxID=3040935 RepID=UPI0025500FA3|nr:bifunctional diguanylate cyclase/phosphodiesterase [Acidisoma sp. PAMC 29798]